MKSMVIRISQPIQCEKPASIARAIAFLKAYGAVVMMSVMLLGGLCAGAVQVKTKGGTIPALIEMFISQPWKLSSKTPIMVFADSFSVSFLAAALMLFFAVTPSGMITVPAVLFLRGGAFGVLAGVLAVRCGFAGLGYFVSVALAGAFLASLSYIYFSQYCLDFSIAMLKELLGKTQLGFPIKEQFKELLFCFAYAVLMLAFSSLVDTALFMTIGRSFEISGV